jgi:tRNA(Arg) A34 adenosine deaminase TadA
MNHTLTLKKITRDIECVGNQRLAACIVRGTRVISFGHNKRKTHPLQTRFAKNQHCVYLHAEIDAIKNALKELKVEDLKQCTLIVVRTKKDGSTGLAKPCKGCRQSIETFELKQVVYSTDKEGCFEELF